MAIQSRATDVSTALVQHTVLTPMPAGDTRPLAASLGLGSNNDMRVNDTMWCGDPKSGTRSPWRRLLPAVVLIDERDARREARRRGWPVMGTLGLVRAAADRRIEGLDLAEALARLRRTNFRASEAVFAEILRDA